MMIATAPQQALLPMRVIVPRTMVGRNGARAELKCSDQQLDEWMQTGALRGVLNISAADTGCRELRFALQCLTECDDGRPVERDDEELAALVFGELPRLAGWASCKHVHTRLNCHHSTLANLIEAKAIRLAEGSRWRPGAGGSPKVAWSELVRFVGERRQDTGKKEDR